MGDADFFIDYMNANRRHHDRAARKAQALEQAGGAVFMSPITRFELAAGIEMYHDPDAERVRVQSIVRRFPSLPLTNEAADRAGSIHGGLLRDGLAVGAVDAIVAAVALENQYPVLTRNMKHFSRIQGLTLETY